MALPLKLKGKRCWIVGVDSDIKSANKIAVNWIHFCGIIVLTLGGSRDKGKHEIVFH